MKKQLNLLNLQVTIEWLQSRFKTKTPALKSLMKELLDEELELLEIKE
jgi:hypothetical protein